MARKKLLRNIPGWEGSIGPAPSQYGQPHVYARDVYSGAGNCVCGRESQSTMHVPTQHAPTGGYEIEIDREWRPTDSAVS